MEAAGHKRTAVQCELAAELVRQHGHLRFRALGTSMLPAIWPGDILSIRSVPIIDISAGEVVVFARNSSLFAHRVVCNAGTTLITRGDAVSDNDSPVVAAEFLGRVDTLVRNGRERFAASTLNTRQRVFSLLLRRSELFTRAFLRLYALRCKLLRRAPIMFPTTRAERIEVFKS